MVLITGGARFIGSGARFIGSNFVLDWLSVNGEPVVNLDLLTYAGNLENLASLEGNSNHNFVRGNIGDGHGFLFENFNQAKTLAVVGGFA